MSVTPCWEVLGETVLLDSPHVRVIREKMRTPSCPDGREWTKVIRKVGVSIAPRLPDGSFVLIREERVPARRDFWQFPAGQVEDTSAPEADIVAVSPDPRNFSSPGFTDEHVHQFVAPDARWDRAAASHDNDEQILEIKAFTVAELRNMVAERVIEDANTLGLYARLEAGGWLS